MEERGRKAQCRSLSSDSRQEMKEKIAKEKKVIPDPIEDSLHVNSFNF